MKKQVSFKYTETIVPYRCRKPRPVQFDDGSVEVEIREATKEEAPIAIVGYDCLNGQTTYRWYDNQLWTQYSTFRRSDPAYTHGDINLNGHFYNTKAENETLIRKRAAKTIIVDDEVWKTAGEPRYTVMTFGLGHNHSRTALMTGNGYNSNIGWSRYYRVDQFAEAVAEATRTALARGDTKSVPITPSALFYVLIPEAVRIDPKTEHGPGNEFMNRCEGVIQSFDSPAMAGIGLFFVLSKEIQS